MSALWFKVFLSVLVYWPWIKRSSTLTDLSLRQLQFQLVTSPRYGPQRSNSTRLEPSRLRCAHTIRVSYPTFVGFLYNKNSTRCTPISSLTLSQPAPSSAEGAMYYSGKCLPGFDFWEVNRTSACLKFVLTNVTYAAADVTCRAMSGYLMSVKNLAKLNMLIQISGEVRSWVGLDDIVAEDIFVWKEDGSVLASQLRVQIFGPGEPNNIYGQDCVEFYPPYFGLNDYSCSSINSFVCEADLVY